MDETESVQRPESSYRWVIAGACFLMVFTALGFCSSPKGLYLSAVTEDLGIPRSLFSFNDSCRYITTALVNLFFGRLILKMGPRMMILCGFLSLTASCLLYSVSSSVYLFYLGGCLLGLGLAWTTTTLVGYLVDRWFRSRRGTVMGVILAANGLGGAAASQVISPLIYGARSDGWRTSYRLTALLLAVVGVLVVLLVRSSPPRRTMRHPREPQKTPHVSRKTARTNWEGISLSAAKQKPYFYVSLVCVFFTGMILQSGTGVSSACMKDCGIAPAVIAAVVSIHSVFLACSKIVTGFAFDRFGLRVTMLSCSICSIAALLLLSFVSNNGMAYSYGVISAFALPLETVMLPLIALDMFGEHSYSKIMGLFISCNTLGYAVGAPALNFFFDKTGSYRNSLLFLAGFMLVVSTAMQLAISSARRTRRLLEQQALEKELP